MITCALHMVQISAETSASSLGPFHLGGKNASAKAVFFSLGKGTHVLSVRLFLWLLPYLLSLLEHHWRI